MKPNRQGDPGRLFIGIYPAGIVYADRSREVGGDYKRAGFLSYATLELTIAADCPRELRTAINLHASRLQRRRGEQFEVGASGQTVLLGSALPA